MHRTDLGLRLAALSDGARRPRAGSAPLLLVASVLVLAGLAAPRPCIERAVHQTSSCSRH
jgi:hypothetical protein